MFYILPYLASAALAAFCLKLIFQEEKTKNQLLSQYNKEKQHLYQTAVLKEIQERTGYSADLERVLDVITGSLKNLFPFSTASSLLIKDSHLVFKAHIEESVSHAFINDVQKSMFASLSTLTNHQIPLYIDESLQGVLLDDTKKTEPASFFHIPLNINDKIVGVISIASTSPNLYREDEMTILYQIISQATLNLSKLQNVLTTEKSKLVAMVGSLADGVFMVDVKNELLVINDAAKQFLKIKSDNPTIIDILASFGQHFAIGEKITQAVSSSSPVTQQELKLNERILQVFITPVLNPLTPGDNKDVLGASVLLHDITFEKSIAQMKEDFTNIMVHELRSPLTAIKSATDLLADKTNLADSDKNQLLRLINEQAGKLLEEISYILDAAKLEAGLFTVKKEQNDLVSLLNERLNFFLPQAKQKDIFLKGRIEELPEFSFDKNYLAKVLNNLLSNSLKFTPKGGTILLEARKVNNEAVVTIKDTGVGIPKDKQPLLFTRFGQIRHPSAAVGTGLGLYLVKGVINAHNGKITLESAENVGTTITFTLPLSQEVEKKSFLVKASPNLFPLKIN